jgi:hypothetical protein
MKNIFLITLLFLSSCADQETSKSPLPSPTVKKCFLAKSVKYVIDLKGTVIKSKGKRYKIKLDPSLKGQKFMLKEGIRLEDKPDRKDRTKTIVTCQYEAYHQDKPDVIIGKVNVLGQKVAQK